jgi:hypothetical protein
LIRQGREDWAAHFAGLGVNGAKRPARGVGPRGPSAHVGSGAGRNLREAFLFPLAPDPRRSRGLTVWLGLWCAPLPQRPRRWLRAPGILSPRSSPSPSLLYLSLSHGGLGVRCPRCLGGCVNNGRTSVTCHRRPSWLLLARVDLAATGPSLSPRRKAGAGRRAGLRRCGRVGLGWRL